MTFFNGIQVQIVPDRPCYQLPERLTADVGWPPGFRDEINAWARAYLGSTNFIPDGDVLVGGNRAFVNPRTFEALKKAHDGKEGTVPAGEGL